MAKIGFEYEYANVYDIYRDLRLESSELLYLPFLIAIFFLSYYFIHRVWPTYIIYLDYRKQQRNKLKKKQFIERIKLQNEIEDEVEKDLK